MCVVHWGVAWVSANHANEESSSFASGVCFASSMRSGSMAEHRRRFSLTVELTPFCNQACRHCYNAFDHTPTGTLATKELLILLDRALGEVAFERVTFSGGEPFACESLLPAMELCSARGIRANVVSNATLITPRVAQEMARFPSAMVQVTLSGPTPEIHDASVGTPGAWQKLHMGVDLLRKNGLTVLGSIVITRCNFDLVGATLGMMQAMGITTVVLMRFLTGGMSALNLDLLPTRSELLEALRQASQAKFRDMSLRVGGPMPPCVLDQEDFPTIRFGSCPAGTSDQDFALGSDGYMRLCPLFPDAIGDPRTTSVAEIVRSPAVTNYRQRTPEFCRGCVALPRCLGGCGAAALAASGDANSLDPIVLQHTDARFARRTKLARQERIHLGPSNR
ncbi:MAG: radical SAM protein [Polyangia bacterium]|jgi:radical SAM protein with 4Fe4S-binding SPASM domain